MKFNLFLFLIWFLGLFSQVYAQNTESNNWQVETDENKVILIELFTSQGCSSCPPAEKLVNNLINDDKLWFSHIPLVFHVDYWDYTGWKDPFAQKKFSQRQKFYQVLKNIRSVYTPGWLVNGKEWKGFFRGKEIPQISEKTVPLSLTINKNNATIVKFDTHKNIANFDAKAINVAILGSDFQHSVTRGENRGLILESNFVVLEHWQEFIVNRKLNNWQIKLKALKLEPQKNIQYALVGWINDGKNQPIQAVGGWIDRRFLKTPLL